ncbi:MAG: GTP-binding protein, partial [candidate division WOR-3 bacterium]
MKEYGPEQIRNLGFFGHGGSGKTSICESLLLTMKQNNRLGSVADGTSLLDYDDDEVARKISINLALGHGEYRDVLMNLVDVPGYADFFGNVVSAVRAIDTAVVVVDATAGVEVGTEMAWRKIDEAALPRVIFVNKLSREHASFATVVDEVRKVFGTRATPLYLPIGAESQFHGVVDVLNERAYLYEGATRKEVPVPAEMGPMIVQTKERLIEAAAEADETLMEKFLEGATIAPEEVRLAVRNGIKAGTVFPMMCGDALTQVGIDLLLDLAVDVLPSPAEMPGVAGETLASSEAVVRPDSDGPACAFVFKTVSESHVGEMHYVRVFRGKLEPGMVLVNTTSERDEKLNQLF